MATLKVAIIGKDKLAYEGEADAVFVPTKTGIIEVLPNHTQLISALQAGEIIVKTAGSDPAKDGASKIFKVTGGVLEVRANSNVIILADIIKE
jgi:F-type H+-transporting ATPase subunit epsilon